MGKLCRIFYCVGLVRYFTGYFAQNLLVVEFNTHKKPCFSGYEKMNTTNNKKNKTSCVAKG